MKYTRKNRAVLIRLLLFGTLIGTLGWELFERLLAAGGFDLSLGVGPVGFDVHVLAVSLYVNPGTFFGIAAAVLLFRRL